MYSETKDTLLDGLLYAAFKNNWSEIDDAPSDDELANKYPVPEGGAKKYVKIYKRMARKKRLTPWVIVKRAAVIFLAIVSAVFAILMTNDDVRAAIFDTVTKWIKYNDTYKLEFSRSNVPVDDNNDDAYDFEIGYIPDELILYEKHENELSRTFKYRWDNENDEMILSIDISPSSSTTLEVDGLRSEIEHTMINGMNTYIAYWNDDHQGSVTMGNKRIIISIWGRLDRNELIKIAESIK